MYRTIIRSVTMGEIIIIAQKFKMIKYIIINKLYDRVHIVGG